MGRNLLRTSTAIESGATSPPRNTCNRIVRLGKEHGGTQTHLRPSNRRSPIQSNVRPSIQRWPRASSVAMSAPALKPRALGCPSTCAGSTIQQQGAAMRWGASTRGDAKGRSHSARTVSMRIMRAASRPTTAVPRWRAAPFRGLVPTARQKTARQPTFLCLLMESSMRHCSMPPSGICDDEEHSAQKDPGLAWVGVHGKCAAVVRPQRRG